MLIGWRDFNDTLRTIDFFQRHFDHAFDGLPVVQPRVVRRAAAAGPSINVTETPEAYVYRAAVPGLGEGDVHVRVEAGTLVLRGERKADAPKDHDVRLRERALPASFARTLPLPGRVDAEAVTAALKDGILTVTLPKAKDALPRSIAVKAL